MHARSALIETDKAISLVNHRLALPQDLPATQTQEKSSRAHQGTPDLQVESTGTVYKRLI